MGSSPNSSSDRAFDRLDERIKQWIRASGWSALRDAQAQAIPVILDGDADLIIAASTAAGKTEAAFFPVMTALAQSANPRAMALYVSPLKALINDQQRRMEEIAERMDMLITPWHGDVLQSRKTKFMKSPGGCLLITPESLEAFLMRHGGKLPQLFAGLQFVVIDEMHAFLDDERGKQLQSLLHRIEVMLHRRIRRIGLSATLGEMEGARRFLRPQSPDDVVLIESKDAQRSLMVLIRGGVEKEKPRADKTASAVEMDSLCRVSIAEDLYRNLRGGNHLVFPNTRKDVEYYADRLRRMCEDRGVPNEFWPHHGNLSKELREDTETALKQTDTPTTVICTSTLELGIDIGPVKSVVQIGPPPSVASLRQRLGRSGRRVGEPMILRGYCIEKEITQQSKIEDLLRFDLTQMIAMTLLLVKGWYEPIPSGQLHGSTLVQQTLSLLAQYGGLRFESMRRCLCDHGPFSSVTSEQYASLIRRLGQEDLVFQNPTGDILLTPKGEKFTEDYRFYASFRSDEEYRILYNGRLLGSMPISNLLHKESCIIFAGRRWQVAELSQNERVIEVKSASKGARPEFDSSSGIALYDGVRQKMREVLGGEETYSFLDDVARRMLQEARDNYCMVKLAERQLIPIGNDVLMFTWLGDRISETLLLMLQSRGLDGESSRGCVALHGVTIDDVAQALRDISSSEPPDLVLLARIVENKVREKWDALLPTDLLDANFASAYLDVPGAMELARSLSMQFH